MLRFHAFASLWLLVGWSGLAAAQSAHLDPQTNQLSAPAQAPSLSLTPDELNGLSTAHDGLREQALPEGGYQLDLQGRFQYSMFAVIAPDGQVRIDHGIPGMEVHHAHQH